MINLHAVDTGTVHYFLVNGAAAALVEAGTNSGTNTVIAYDYTSGTLYDFTHGDNGTAGSY